MLRLCALLVAGLVAAEQANGQPPVKEYGSPDKLGDSLTRRSKGSNPFNRKMVRRASTLAGALNAQVSRKRSSFGISMTKSLGSSLGQSMSRSKSPFNRNAATSMAKSLGAKGNQTGTQIKKSQKSGNGDKPIVRTAGG